MAAWPHMEATAAAAAAAHVAEAGRKVGEGQGVCEMGLAMRVWGCQGDSLEFVSAAKHL